MRDSLDLWRITCADLIVRTAYQVGKTPLMPLFAASLGAGELLVGAIVSVSTMTGMCSSRFLAGFQIGGEEDFGF